MRDDSALFSVLLAVVGQRPIALSRLGNTSIKTGKQKGSLSTRLHNNTRFTIDEFVKICDACGWQLVLKRGNKQFDLRGIDENKPRADVKK